MAQTQINGGTQIKSGTITTTQLSSSAGITDAQLATSYIKADGTRAFTGNLLGGGFEAQNFTDPTASSSLATKSYVDNLLQGINAKYSARAATLGSESFTISSGTVTQITGTTVDGISVAVNEFILIKDAPASTGTGSVSSSQPGNGLYKVTNATTNLSVTRADNMNNENPAGAYVFVEAGTQAGGGYVVTTPSSSAAFTYGSGNIQWTQFSGAGQITVDSTLTKTGNQIVRAAITGDVTISSGSNSSTIAAAAVSLSKMANLAANSVIGNSTGSGATPTAITLAAAATASSIPFRDTNANLTVNALITGVATTATAGGTTTLSASSVPFQQFTGSTTQTVVLPNATTMSAGGAFTITNRSSGAVTVNMNGGSNLQTMGAGSQLVATLINNGSSAGTWDALYSVTASGGSGTVTSVSVVSANGFAGSVATSTSTPAITISTSITGILKGNGTAISAASASTDYMAPAGFVTRETPTGTINGSNTSFSLANTPISGSESIFLNGVLQDSGAGNDYTISGSTITMLSAPLSGDKIRVNYMK